MKKILTLVSLCNILLLSFQAFATRDTQVVQFEKDYIKVSGANESMNLFGGPPYLCQYGALTLEPRPGVKPSQYRFHAELLEGEKKIGKIIAKPVSSFRFNCKEYRIRLVDVNTNKYVPIKKYFKITGVSTAIGNKISDYKFGNLHMNQ